MSYFNAMRLLDQNGTPYGVKNVGNKIRVSAMDYLFDIAEGNIPDHEPVLIIGLNTDVDNANAFVWPGGDDYVFPSAAMQMEIVSSDAGDNATGDGIRSVELHYLDANFDRQEESITLNGTTPVPTVATDIIRVQHIHTLTTGSSQTALGSISLRHLSNSPVYGGILSGENESLSAVWTVPDGYTAYIVGCTLGCGASSAGHYTRFHIRATCSHDLQLTPGVFHSKYIAVLQDSSNSKDFQMPIKLPSRADIIVTAISDGSSANVYASAALFGWMEL